MLVLVLVSVLVLVLVKRTWRKSDPCAGILPLVKEPLAAVAAAVQDVRDGCSHCHCCTVAVTAVAVGNSTGQELEVECG